ncbi:MAG: hypothetical protein ACOX2P_05540 [Bacillota bacterium]
MNNEQKGPLGYKDQWLAENMIYLTENTDCGLGIFDCELEAGVFNVDVFCEDELGNSFVRSMEPEKGEWGEKLSHLLNYSVGASAKTIIWLSPNPCERHVEMIKWLDEVTPEIIRWYLFKIEAIKVGNSTPVPFFTMIYSPSQEVLCSEKEELAEKYRKRVKFWEGLLTVLNEKMQVYLSINVPKEEQGEGITGSYYQMLVWTNGTIRMARIF